MSPELLHATMLFGTGLLITFTGGVAALLEIAKGGKKERD
jgi:hypothetical protein